MITGIPIEILVKTETGVDAFNKPVYEEVPETVQNVLVGQPSTNEVLEVFNLTGRRAAYWLGIPKGDTHDWELAKVILPAPFAGKYQAIGTPVSGIESNIPLSWNTKVLVEKYG